LQRSPNEKGIVFAAEDDASGTLEAGEGACALRRVDSSTSGNGAAFGVAEGSIARASSFALADTASGLARLPGRPPKGLVRFLLLAMPMLWAVSPRSLGRHFCFHGGLTPIQTAISGHVF
jgi:hypothetical protein